MVTIDDVMRRRRRRRIRRRRRRKGDNARTVVARDVPHPSLPCHR